MTFQESFYGLYPTVSIRIVADCGLQTCQATQKMKRAKTFDFTTVSAIILYIVVRSLFLLSEYYIVITTFPFLCPLSTYL